MRKFFLAGLLIIVAVFFLVIVNTLLFTSKQISNVSPTPLTPDPTNSLEKNNIASQLLGGAIKFKTISSNNTQSEFESEFLAFNRYLTEKFPKSHHIMTKERVGRHSLLYIWKGSQSQHKPALFLSHSDVVPVDSTTNDNWLYPPFSGELADGYIWGRGSMDNKLNIIAQFIAIERLINSGFQPNQTLLFAIGADEETGGNNGARKIAEYLKKHNLMPATTLDEGGVISKNIIPAVSQPVALIGIAEKGYLTLHLMATQPGGHASMPPRQTAIGLLTTALKKLEANSFPRKMTPPIRQMFNFLGPEMGTINKSIFANLWLTENLVKQKLAQSASTNASIQTTMAITQFNSGVAENVLPTSASATINIRLLPGDRIDSIRDKIATVIDDPRIKINTSSTDNVSSNKVSSNHEASSVSKIDTPFFRTLHKTIKQLFPDTLVAPYLTITSTDSRHFSAPENNIYRFSPLPVTKSDLKRIHGINERISTADFNKVVNFYQLLIVNMNLTHQ